MITYEEAYKLACHGMLIEQLQDRLYEEKSLQPSVITWLIELNDKSVFKLNREGYRYYVIGNIGVLGKNINNAIANYNSRIKGLMTKPTRC